MYPCRQYDCRGGARAFEVQRIVHAQLEFRLSSFYPPRTNLAPLEQEAHRAAGRYVGERFRDQPAALREQNRTLLRGADKDAAPYAELFDRTVLFGFLTSPNGRDPVIAAAPEAEEIWRRLEQAAGIDPGEALATIEHLRPALFDFLDEAERRTQAARSCRGSDQGRGRCRRHC